MATHSAFPRSEDLAPPEKKQRTESGDGDKDVREEEEDYDSDLDYIPREVYDKYMKQVGDSDGFEVDYFPEVAYNMYYPIQPLALADYTNKVMPFTKSAITHFNEKEGANIQFQKVVNITQSVCGWGYHYYITFEAMDAADDQTKTFQSKVYYGIERQTVEVEFCRLKPQPTKQGVDSMEL